MIVMENILFKWCDLIAIQRVAHITKNEPVRINYYWNSRYKVLCAVPIYWNGIEGDMIYIECRMNRNSYIDIDTLDEAYEYLSTIHGVEYVY